MSKNQTDSYEIDPKSEQPNQPVFEFDKDYFRTKQDSTEMQLEEAKQPQESADPDDLAIDEKHTGNFTREEVQVLRDLKMEVAESPASERTPKGVTNIHILMKYLQETTSPAVTLYLIQSMREETMSNLDLYIP